MCPQVSLKVRARACGTSSLRELTAIEALTLRIIDNINELLGDDLKSELTKGSKLRVAASTFSIYAFEALREELEKLEQLDFIFTAPAFTAPQATDKARRDVRRFYIPNEQASGVEPLRVGV